MPVSSLVYTAYGYHNDRENRSSASLKFHGEYLEPVLDIYMLGKGYRGFRLGLMRFCSPDSWSPFGGGGLNAYAYCAGDPVNLIDPTGHMPFKGLMKSLKISSKNKSMSNSGKRSQGLTSGFSVNHAGRPVFVGFHGTDEAAAQSILKSGVLSNSKSDSFFVANTFSSANEYASLKGQGAVLAVYTERYAELHSVSTRSVVKQSNIPQLKIPKVAQEGLRFEVVRSADRSSNFNRFMTEHESAVYWITQFRRQ
ncbi:RHS repeat-associated core domain-containing protein [Pseudomonas monteilii]|uniref:RHS repeat-associated core domain-containing protein n=1 Tax=Pseudomonas monteilii TaxID=76759 RepID=UPI003D0875F4